MKILGFNFNKQSVERFEKEGENLKINTNINILNISEVKSDLFKLKEEVISVKFSYSINYDPEIAKIEFEGNLLLAVEPDLSKELFKQWKNKKMPEEFRIVIFNIILKKSNIKALQLEDDLNIPIHISLPILKKQEKESER